MPKNTAGASADDHNIIIFFHDFNSILAFFQLCYYNSVVGISKIFGFNVCNKYYEWMSAMVAKLEQYRIFKEVADSGNLTAAAQKLYISQSAVSQCIKSLEASLEAQLFARHPRGVSLSRPRGSSSMNTSARRWFCCKRVSTGFSRCGSGATGELSIGINSTLMKYYLMPILEAYHKAYPQIRIHIHGGTSGHVLEQLKDGQVDLAFATTPPEGGSFQTVHCFTTHTAFVAAPDFDCDFSRLYTLEEITRFPLLVLDRAASSRRFLEAEFLKRGLKLEPEMESASHNLLISLARIGLGVACVTREMSLSGLDRGVIRELKCAEHLPTRSVSMCTLRGAEPSAAAKRFAEFVREDLKNGARI